MKDGECNPNAPTGTTAVKTSNICHTDYCNIHIYITRLCSGSINLHEREKLNQKWSGIWIGISGLIPIWIRISARSLQKCCERHSFHQVTWNSAGDCIASDCMRNATNLQKSTVCNGEGSKKRSGIRIWDWITTKKLISSSNWRARSQHQVSVKSADYFCSNRAHRQKQWLTELHNQRWLHV